MSTDLPLKAEPAQNCSAQVIHNLAGEENARAAQEVREMFAEAAASAVCPPITSASVRVMRSHDYCHFEVVLGSEYFTDSRGTRVSLVLDPEQVDALRKTAARLVDKAVEQFKIAKEAAGDLSRMEELWLYKQALKVPPEARDPQQKAIVKFHEDKAFRASFDYDYEDDWRSPVDEDHDARSVYEPGEEN